MSNDNVHIQSNFEEVTKQLGYLQDVNQRRVAVVMAIEAKRLMKARIKKGISINGQPFNKYSKKPLYVSAKSGIIKATGATWGKEYGRPKRRRKTFESGKKKGQVHASRFFAGGYREFREKSGRSLNSNRLTWSGKMLMNLSINMYGTKGVALMFSRDEENAKALGNQERYNFFGLTVKEQGIVGEYAKLEEQQILREIGFQEG